MKKTEAEENEPADDEFSHFIDVLVDEGKSPEDAIEAFGKALGIDGSFFID